MLNEALFQEENRLWQQGYQLLSGMDEAGRGPLAGPVVSACVYIPKGLMIEGIDDSKKLSQSKRERLYNLLVQHPEIQMGVGIVDESTIDTMNILQATLQSMREAYQKIPIKTDFVLIDGVFLKLPVPTLQLIKGDQKSYLIAAASIIAKVTRDRLMLTYHQKWPEYGFDQHKGYGTQKHREALRRFGPCPIHRTSFEPIKSLLNL